jgi:hypothetical protein
MCCYSGVDKSETVRDGVSIMLNKNLQKYVATLEPLKNI